MTIFLRSVSRLCSSKDLILSEFAQKSNRNDVSESLSAYVKSSNEFSGLIERYNVFCDKEVSVEHAARLVGLQVPAKK